jgi:hypothetical protein
MRESEGAVSLLLNSDDPMQLFKSDILGLQVTRQGRIHKMKKAILVLAGTACLALLPAFALGQQDSKAPTDDAKTTTTQNDMAAKADQNCDNRGKSKKKQKKDPAKKAPAKEPTENEKIFDEMLRSAASSGGL